MFEARQCLLMHETDANPSENANELEQINTNIVCYDGVYKVYRTFILICL